MLNRCLVLTVLILLTAGLAAAYVAGQPEMNVQTRSSDDEAAKKAGAFLAQWDKNDMPGCAVGVMRDGKLIYKQAVGMANLDYDVPNTTQTLFNLASASKPFTAMSIALLAEQGKLSLDDDIRKYVPEIPAYAETITIRHLLYHTSGIREYQALLFFGGQSPDNALTDKMILDLLARQKNVSFAPGTKHQYSNSNYHLLGIIVGRASGKSLREFAEENIFKPLAMKNTRYFDNRQEIVKNRASGYVVGADKRIRARASLFDLVGGGGVLTTVEDWALWDRNFYEPKIGGKELMAQMSAPGTLNNGEKIGYAFGLFLNKYRGLPVFKHSGNMSGFRAQTITFPEQKFTAVALCNNSAIFPGVIVEKLADIYLDGQLKTEAPPVLQAAETVPEAVALPEKEARRLAGVYTSGESGAAFKLTFKDGKLIAGNLLKNEAPLVPVAENRFLIIDGNNKFELVSVLNKSGAVSEMKLTKNGGAADIFAPARAPLDAPAQLAEYVGTYDSDELAAEHRITLDGNKLVLQIGDNFKNPLIPAAADYFTIGGGAINFSFVRDERGKITGFVFNSALDDREVKRIAFRRQ